MTRKVWIDCDVGVDDAIALIVAQGLPELELVGVSSVAGNAKGDKTYENCKRVLDFIGCDAPLYRGADAPLLRPLVTAPYIHGEDGLGGAVLPAATLHKEDNVLPAWDALYEKAVELGGELELIAVGPLTNVATALAKYAELPRLLRRIVIMGGAASGGNRTPVAEFNIYVDPEAAQLVFNCGVPTLMVGLDVTNHALLTPPELTRLREMGSKYAEFFFESRKVALAYLAQKGIDDTALHDPCAVVAAARPELFSCEEVGVQVETRSELTRGKTVTDLYSDHQFENKNALIVTDLNRPRFAELILTLLGA